MPDPNKPISQQLIREARIGLTIVALLAGLFCYVAWNRFSGNWNNVPEHVANAPIAQNMNQEFREEHRQQLAKLDQTPRVVRNDPNQENPRTQNASTANPIQQTFTQQRINTNEDSVANSQKVPQPHLPISTNELRATSDTANDSNVQPASFTDDQNNSPEKFDDPFGSASTTSKPETASSTGSPDFVPRKPFKLSDEEASEFKPNLSTPQKSENNNSPTSNAPPSNTDGTGFRSNPRQPPVVMQRTRFQVQVTEEPDASPSLDQSVSQKTNTVDAGSINSDFNPIRQPQVATNLPIKQHKPLTRAEDFATHSLHPPQPTNPKANAQLPEAPSTQKTVTGLKEQYTVQTRQQTLWEIAQEVYGDGRLFRALYEVNQNNLPNPDVIQVGTNLVIPSLEELVQNYRDHVPQDLVPTDDSEWVHVTQTGDTLFDIARQRLGQASRFNELMELNRGRLPLDVTHLSPLSAGMQIELPNN